MRRLTVTLLAGIAGCGPAVGDGDTSAGSTGSTGEDTGTTAVSVGETTVGESTGGIASCEAFHDEAATSAATIEIRNVGTQTLLFNAPCFGYDYLELATVSELRWPGGFCTQTCEQEFVSGCIVCGAGCAIAAYTVAAPGDVITIEWDGRLFERTNPPASCFESGMCAPSCQQARADYDETVTVTVEAITQEDCLAVETEPGACECDPTDEGPCQAFGSSLIDPTVQASIDVAPGTASIVVEVGG